MGRKDHLGTPDENYRRRAKELKKSASTVTQGNPPVFTRGLNQAGILGKTQHEVRGTDFPLLFDVADKTNNILVDDGTDNLTYEIDLSKQDAHFQRLLIADVDSDSDPITNIDVNFINLAQNKEIQFTIEWIKDVAMVATPTITFSPPLNGVPAQPSPFPDDFDVWYFLISGRTLPDNTTRYELLNVGTGSGGGNSFPILYPEETIGSIGGPTQNINISGSDGQFKEMTLTGNVNLTFSGFPSATVLENFWLLVNQDGVGGHSLTATGSTLKNAGTLNSLVDKAINAQTLLHFSTGDAGTTIHGELVDLVASGGGFSGNLSDLVIDVDKDWNAMFITNLAGLDLFANSVANGITNASFVGFNSNAGADRGQIGRSDFFGSAQGLAINIVNNDSFVILANTVQKVKFDDNADLITTEYDLNMMDNFITNFSYIESSTPNRPGTGQIRLASSNRIAWRNPGNTDDIFIGVGDDSQSAESFQVIVASGIALTVSDLVVDVRGNNIIDIGNMTVAAGSHDIGDSSDSWTDIFGQYFRPIGAAPTTKDGYTRVSDNRHLISYDSGTPESGFGVYQDGVQRFLLSTLATTSPFIHEFFIGGDPFTAGEEYRIQMGENSNASARIYFIEGIGNDLILDRAGGSIDQGVQVRVNGLSAQRWLSAETKFFKEINMNSLDIRETKNIWSDDDSPNNQIGDSVVGTHPGGFNYFVSQRITWEGDFDTYIEMNGSALSVISDDDLILAASEDMILSAVDTANWFIGSTTGLNIFVGGVIKFTIQDNALVTYSGVDHVLLGTSNILMNEGYLEMDSLGSDPSDPTGDKGRMFAKIDTDTANVTPFWIDPLGNITSMLSGGGGGGIVDGTSIVKTADEDRINTTTLELDDEMKFIPQDNTVYFLELDIKYHSEAAAMKIGIQGGNDMTYQIVKSNIDSNGRLWVGPSLSNTDTVELNASPSTDILGSVFVIIQVNDQIDEVGISYAQVNGQGTPTTMLKGSCLRVFGEGVNSGGGGTQGTVENNLITTDATILSNGEGHTDTNNLWLGRNNGDQDVGINLPSSNPGSPQVTYTMQAADFPSKTFGYTTPTSFGFTMAFNVNNRSGSNALKYIWQVYINGVAQFVPETSIGLDILNGRGGYGVWSQAAQGIVQPGDVIGLAIWQQAAAGTITLDDWSVGIWPTVFEVDNSEIHHIMITDFDEDDDDGERTVVSTKPRLPGGADFGGQTTFSEAGASNYRVNGKTPRWPFTDAYGVVFQGAEFDGTYETLSAVGSGSFGFVNSIRIPSQIQYNEYQTLSRLGSN